jgi:hypothetical protein
MTDEEHQAALELLSTWVLAQKVTAFSAPTCERIDLGWRTTEVPAARCHAAG